MAGADAVERQVIDTLLSSSARNFEVNLQRLVPAVSEQELRDELHILVTGYVKTASTAAGTQQLPWPAPQRNAQQQTLVTGN